MDKKNISGAIKSSPVKIKAKSPIKKYYKTIIAIVIIVLIVAGGALGIIKYTNWKTKLDQDKTGGQEGAAIIKIDTEILEEIKDWKYHGIPIDLEKEFTGRDNPFILY